MFTPSLMLLSKSSSTTPPGQDLNRREQREHRISFPSPFALFAPVLSSSARTLVLNWSCQTRNPAVALQEADFIIAVIQCERRAAVKPSRVFGSFFAFGQEARKPAFSGVRVFFFGNEDQYQTTSETKGPAARPLGSARGGRDKWLATSPRLFPALSPCPRSGAARFDSRS